MAKNKVIYTMAGGKFFKINQDVSVPTSLYLPAKQNHVTTQIDEKLKTLNANICVSTLETSGVKTNKELANAMLCILDRDSITEIDTISNNFKIYIDYSMYNNCCELDHQVLIKPITPIDMIVPLGVATNNELVYRRVKTFKPELNITISNPLPLGMMESKSKGFRFKINDITIYQDLSTLTAVSHNSIYCTPYGANCHKTIDSELSKYTPIYSTASEGVCIGELSTTFVPRKVNINLDFALASLIVFYDELQVKAILDYNIDKKYNPDSDSEGSDDPDEGHLIPDSSKYPDADGNTTPDADGWYDYYERCLSTNPKALLVVESNMSDAIFNPNEMIRKSKILLDLPDIEVGEYVRYVRAHKEMPNDPNYPSTPVDPDSGHHAPESADPDKTGLTTGTITTDSGNSRTVAILSIDDLIS